MNDKVYTPEELAERWQCHVNTVYATIKSGKLRAFRVGHQLRIAPAEVARYENGQMT